jgi:non-ribosomal peptide synthase protein (TIGR01720 family)
MDALLMTAIGTSLTEWTGDPVLPIDVYVPGRDSPFEDVDLSRTVGWLTYRYPVWLTISPDLSPLQRARSVAEQLRRVPVGGLGSGALRYFRGDPALSALFAAQPVPQVAFNFFGIPVGGGFQVLRPLGGMSGHYHDVESERMRPLMINGTIVHGQLRLEWEYSGGLHDDATIQSRIDRANEALVEIIDAKEGA